MSTSSAVFTLSLGFSYPELNRFISPWWLVGLWMHGCFIGWQWHRANISDDSVELSRKETIYEDFVCNPLCVVICQSSRHDFPRLKDRSPRDPVLPCDINMRPDCMSLDCSLFPQATVFSWLSFNRRKRRCKKANGGKDERRERHWMTGMRLKK